MHVPGEEGLVASPMLIGIALAADIVAHTPTVPSPSITLTMVGSDIVTSIKWRANLIKQIKSF